MRFSLSGKLEARWATNYPEKGITNPERGKGRELTDSKRIEIKKT